MYNLEHVNKIAEAVRKNWKGGKHIVIIAPPKSASTFFANLLAASVNLQMVSYSDAISGPNALSIDAAIAKSRPNAVSRTHSLATLSTIGLLQGLNARPIVLTRDIKDSLVSLTDHHIKAQKTRFDIAIAQMDRADAYRLTAYEWAKWYVDYNQGWSSVPSKSILMLDYNDIVTRPSDSVKAALAHVGYVASDDAVRSALSAVMLDKGRSNLNVGVAGRGSELPDDVSRVVDLLLGGVPQSTERPKAVGGV